MATNAEVTRMRALVARTLARRERGGPYPSEFREAVMAYARMRVGEGFKLALVTAEIGIPYWTVWDWLRAERRATRQALTTEASTAIVPVQIVPARLSQSAAPSLTVHGPRGLRIDGLDIDTLAELLRRLS